MRAENPAALRFILQDDIYLLQSDKIRRETIPAPPVETIIAEPVAKLPEPVIVTTPILTPVPAYKYQGENKKHFLILTHYLNEDFIAADHLVALQSILKRKDVEITDVAILNTGKNVDTGFNTLLAFFKPERLLILGKEALPAGIETIILNQPKQLQNCTVLYSFNFDEMMSSTDNKKAFWDQMKNL